MKNRKDPTLDPRYMLNPTITPHRIVSARLTASCVEVVLKGGIHGKIPVQELVVDNRKPTAIDAVGPYELVLLYTGNCAARIHVDMLHSLLTPQGRLERDIYLRTHEAVVGRALKVFRNLHSWSVSDLARRSGVDLARLIEIEDGAFVSLAELMPVMQVLEADYATLRLAELAAGGTGDVRVVELGGPKVAA